MANEGTKAVANNKSGYEYYDFGFKPNLPIGDHEDGKIEEIINKYRQYFVNGKIIELDFALVNKDGDFEIFDGEVKIVLPAAESTLYGGKYKGYNVRKARKLLEKYQVVVTGIDEENRVITVSHSKAIKKMRDELRLRLQEDLSKNKNKRIVLPAKVVRVDTSKNVVVVDICRYGLYGYVPAARWRQTFVGDVSRVAKPGDQVDVCIIGYRKHPLGRNSANMFLCSRKELTKDPWIGIEERFHKNDIVLIECVELRPKNWFGTIKGLEDIQVFCEYPDASNRAPEGLRIVLGETYQGYLYSVSEERHLLKARVFKHVERTEE